MASIFTFAEPARVASPWLHSSTEDKTSSEDNRALRTSHPPSEHLSYLSLSGATDNGQGVTRLQAEPQEGPVEYKLHLLLRPRRRFQSTSTGTHISGSRHSRFGNGHTSRSVSEAAIEPVPLSGASTPPTASVQQTRQHRLEQLTTQLLWRLQQSSPHHTSSATNIILPSLPEALPELHAPLEPAKLLHGLEESQGALYEIGVSDDGTLVGLAEDEMQESLNNLTAMAACLGCTVQVLRRETVGECEWLEDTTVGRKARQVRRSGKLIVVEALVKPHLEPKSPVISGQGGLNKGSTTSCAFQGDHSSQPSTEQLRITLTGPTASGKSSLLGTLTTSTLDNGKGKSRLSMLKHRHEINTGMTSSVTQELLGYQDSNNGRIEVINYATENVTSWVDLHDAASGGRLIFVSDSAGHPRFRRTTIRGLVGWAPHWTLLCIPADDTDDRPDTAAATNGAHKAPGSAVPEMDLSGAQMDLCLRLRLPLVIVITKLDLASMVGLRRTLTKVLDALKAAGRKPAILRNSAGDPSEQGLQTVDATLIDNAYNIALPLLNDPAETVPIVMTSAVEGTGISNLHALLHELPIPESLSDSALDSGFVFHVEDVYNKPAEVEGVIVSGILHSGRISVGDTGVLGPFAILDLEDSEDSDERSYRRSSSSLPASRSFPGALRNAHLTPPHIRLPNQEWQRFKVTSIRNARLPVHALTADQVGTVAIIPDDTQHKTESPATFSRIRKGMVLMLAQPLSTRSFVARFKREDLESLAVGNHVVFYTASVRASARVVSARAPDSPNEARNEANRQLPENEPFDLDDELQFGGGSLDVDSQETRVAGQVTAPNLLVTFTLNASKEYVVVGNQVLVMPGGGPGLYGGHERGEKGLAGLDGFVGTITETFG